MRILHTSDWHLGQTFHQFDRSVEHQHFLGWLLDVIESEAVDALLIAGDIFDNSNPSATSQALLYQFLTDARRRVAHLNIVLIAGNHDSPGRVEAPAPFLSLFDATVIGQVGQAGVADDYSRVVVPLKNADGQVEAWCLAMPFLRPSDVPRIAGEGDPYLLGVTHLYQQAYAEAFNRCEPGQAIIAMGHCHVSGGQASEDSERRIVIGGAEALPAQLFDPKIAYVALGHLHLAQSVAGDTTRRYSGSPLPMSFSEINYPHQVVLVELAGEAVQNTRSIPVPRAVEMLQVPKTPAPLEEVLVQLHALELEERPETHWPYLLVRVLLSQPEPSLRAQVELALKDKPVRLARIETTTERRDTAETVTSVSVDELNSLKPEEFFQKLYAHRFGNDVPPELLRAFSELLNSQGELV